MLGCEPVFTNHPNKFSVKDRVFAGYMNEDKCQKLCIDKRACKALSWFENDNKCYLYAVTDEKPSDNGDSEYQTIFRPCSE